MSYGFDKNSIVEANTASADNMDNIKVVLDVAEMMRAYYEGMSVAFNLGWEARLHDESLRRSCFAGTDASGYMGVYDDVSYGVYHDKNKLEASRRFWHMEKLSMEAFATYGEALTYAKNGIAGYRGVSVDQLPNMQYEIDWRQMVV